MSVITNIIAATQARLRELYGPEHYYTKRYSSEEMLYCGQVPNWMEDYISHLDKRANILDIGPGYGTLACCAAQLSPAMVATLDRLPLISQAVAKEFKLEVLIGDIERQEVAPVLGLRHDAVLMTEVLEHFNFNPDRTMELVHSILKPSGRLFLSTPDANSAWGYIPGSELWRLPAFNAICNDYNVPAWRDEHVHQYTNIELAELLEHSGFKILKMAYSTSPGGRHFNLECVA